MNFNFFSERNATSQNVLVVVTYSGLVALSSHDSSDGVTHLVKNAADEQREHVVVQLVRRKVHARHLQPNKIASI